MEQNRRGKEPRTRKSDGVPDWNEVEATNEFSHYTPQWNRRTSLVTFSVRRPVKENEGDGSGVACFGLLWSGLEARNGLPVANKWNIDLLKYFSPGSCNQYVDASDLRSQHVCSGVPGAAVRLGIRRVDGTG